MFHTERLKKATFNLETVTLFSCFVTHLGPHKYIPVNVVLVFGAKLFPPRIEHETEWLRALALNFVSLSRNFSRVLFRVPSLN